MPFEKPRFLSLEDVEALHQRTLEIHGGISGLRDLGLLSSAVSMPRQMFAGAYLHDGVPAMAAAYLFHLCKNHAFLDGNKRVAALAALAFLRVNGMSRDQRLPELPLTVITLKVSAGELGKDELTVWFEQQLAGRLGDEAASPSADADGAG